MSGPTLPAGCQINIGSRERRKRLVMGIVMLALGAVFALVFIKSSSPSWWRLVAFILFWLGALGIFQARDYTCVALALRGKQNMDSGETFVKGGPIRKRLLIQARNILIKSFALAALLTAMTFPFPGR